MAIVTTDNKHYSNIATKIREKTGTETTYKPEEIPAGVEEVYEAGKQDGIQSEHDRLWDGFQDDGERTNYERAFGSIWNDNNFKPKYSFRPQNANTMFSHSKITDLQAILDRLGLELDFSGVIYGQLVQFLQDSSITRVGIIDLSSLSSTSYTFFQATKLQTIEKLIFAEKTVFSTNTFMGCISLSNINEVEGVIGKSIGFSDCPLTNASVQNIINCLKDLTGQPAQTLTLKATVGAEVTDAQKAQITAKNWTLVY